MKIIAKHNQPLKKDYVLLVGRYVYADMKFFYTFIFLFFSAPAHTAGWGDFEMDIGDGYSISRSNSMDIILLKDQGEILGNRVFKDVGPIVNYSKSEKEIYIKTIGYKYRNKFEGDGVKLRDNTKEFLFIVDIATSVIKGPFDNSEFQKIIKQEVAWKDLVPEFRWFWE